MNAPSGQARSGDRPKATGRQAATKVARELADAGFIAYFAGGCVRDELLGNEPDDYDIATDARPEQVKAVFRRVRSVGESFGVMLVRLMGHTIEVATFRTDGVYSDGRHPDEVTYSDAEHDAHRRDFTINGLFEDPLATGSLGDRIIDFVGGREDLDKGLVRAIGDPNARLREDQLRMLRGVRFAARFGFRLDDPTATAIRHGAGNLRGVSRERIGQEVRRMMLHPQRAAAAILLQECGLDGVVLDEPCRVVPVAHLKGLDAEAPYASTLGAWLLDRHGTGEQDYTPRCRIWEKALMLSNAEGDHLRDCLVAYQRLRDEWSALEVAPRKRLAASGSYATGLQLLATTDGHAAAAIRRDVDQLAQDGIAPEPLVGGEDLIRAGLTPGPAFGEILNATYDAQLEGRVRSPAEALALARRLAGETDAIEPKNGV